MKKLFPIIGLVVVIATILYVGVTQKKPEKPPYEHPKGVAPIAKVDVTWGDKEYRGVWDEERKTFLWYSIDGKRVWKGDFVHFKDNELFMIEKQGRNSVSFKCKVTKRRSSFDFEGDREGVSFSVRKSTEGQ